MRRYLISQKFSCVDEAVNFVDMLEDTGTVKKPEGSVGGSEKASSAKSKSYAATSQVNKCKECDSHAASINLCLLYTSPSPRDRTRSRMPSSA